MPSSPWWFVNWFVNGLVNWFVNGLVNWFVNGLVNWFVNGLVNWFVVGLSDWFVNWLVNWFDRPPLCWLSATAGGARDNAAPAGGTGMVGGCRAGCRAGCRVGCRSGCREGDEVLDTSAVQGEGGLCGRPRESFRAPTSNAEDAAALSSPSIWETRLSYRAFSLARTR
jgi:hypothetical protein